MNYPGQGNYHGHFPPGNYGGGSTNPVQNLAFNQIPNQNQYGSPPVPANYNSYGAPPFPPPHNQYEGFGAPQNQNPYGGYPVPPPHNQYGDYSAPANYQPYGNVPPPPNYNSYGGPPPPNYHPYGNPPPSNYNSYGSPPPPPPPAHHVPANAGVYSDQYGGIGQSSTVNPHKSGGFINKLEQLTHLDLNRDGTIGGKPINPPHKKH